jgi:pimeloyl-ACP methyl ester carboxylesterase
MVATLRGAPLVALIALAGAAATASAQTAAAVHVDRSGYIAVGADSIFYEVAGSGPAIVLIHDGLVHREIWDAQFSDFAKDHQVIRYDRRGYGRSTPATEAFSNVDDLHRLFAELGIETACLIGMSSGGRLAIDFTLRHPQQVTALVLVGAVVGGFPYTEHFYSRGGRYPSGLSGTEERRAWYAAEDPYEIYAENTAARQRVKALVARFPYRELSPHTASPPAPPSVGRLHEIQVPTLVLVGEFDIPDVHAHAGAIAAGIAGATRDIVPRAGHLIPIEQPTLFNEAVAAFLETALSTQT